MASSNGYVELWGDTHPAKLSLRTKHAKDLTSQTSSLKAKRKRQKKKTDSDWPKGRRTPAAVRRKGWVDKVMGLHNEQGHQFPPQSISLKCLLDAEAKLVYGDEQNLPHKSPASIPLQLMCHHSETRGPRSRPNLSPLPQIDKWLDVALQDASACYRLKKYAVAASHFTAALQLCSKGAVFEKTFSADYEDISKVTGFIESRLVACYLRMNRPDLALPHSHWSIHLNPIHFRSHLQQAMVYRLLGNPCGAARSAMIADYIYWLSGNSKATISKLIKLYWQGLLSQANSMKKDFCVLYTPCFGKPTRDTIQQIEETFRKCHSAFTGYIFTDPDGGHVLPQTTNWCKTSTQNYILTVGFKRKQDGNFLDKLLIRNSPTFAGQQAPFLPPTYFDLHRMCETLGRRILPVLDLIKCTKLAAGFSAGSGLIERLQYADCLYQLKRLREHQQVLEHTLAELAVVPYLQEISPTDTILLQSLMVDTMDTLEGEQTGQERVWNAIQKVGLIEDMLYQWEMSYQKQKTCMKSKKQTTRQRRVLKKFLSMGSSTNPGRGDPQTLQSPNINPCVH